MQYITVTNYGFAYKLCANGRNIVGHQLRTLLDVTYFFRQQDTSRWFCQPYVLQMRRNELKYGFYRQNPAYFPRIYF